MRRHGLLARFAILGALASILVVVAVVDHADKAARMRKADVPWWYCTHQGTRCGEGNPDEIERRWEWRERGYVFVLTALAGTAFVTVRRRTTSEAVSSLG